MWTTDAVVEGLARCLLSVCLFVSAVGVGQEVSRRRREQLRRLGGAALIAWQSVRVSPRMRSWDKLVCGAVCLPEVCTVIARRFHSLVPINSAKRRPKRASAAPSGCGAFVDRAPSTLLATSIETFKYSPVKTFLCLVGWLFGPPVRVQRSTQSPFCYSMRQKTMATIAKCNVSALMLE
uniref:Secreted protein n=1 Tax=Plectus sambesii TaxID=2011161 RepID=A0A914W2H0_9BILA